MNQPVPGKQVSAHPAPPSSAPGSAYSRLGKLAAKPGKAPGGSQPTESPRSARDGDIATGLLNLEREARKAQSESELGYLMVNGSRVAIQYRQAILLLRNGPKKHRVKAVSSLSAVDRTSTFIQWLERTANRKLAGENGAKVLSYDVRNETGHNDLDAKTYPLPQVAFVPLQLRDGTVFGHSMFTREAEWDEASLVASARLCETFSHAWEALSGPRKTKRRLRSKTLIAVLLAGGLVAGSLYPVPLTVLAPAEVTAADPYIVAAPIDGVIETVAVDPTPLLKKGRGSSDIQTPIFAIVCNSPVRQSAWLKHV